MLDESGYRPGVGGSARQQGWSAAQSARVSRRAGGGRPIEAPRRAFALGAKTGTLALVSALRPGENGAVAVGLLALAWTPLGAVLGADRQEVSVPLEELFEWIDRTFPDDDDHAFVASVRDLELLVAVGWESAPPDRLDESTVLNVDDLPEDIAAALARPRAALVPCDACRRPCVRDDFIWNERQLCAWDYHAQVFGKRGPWHEGPYAERHFETLPPCAYVAPELLDELGVDVAALLGTMPESAARSVVNTLIESEGGRAHMAVRTPDGIALLREA